MTVEDQRTIHKIISVNKAVRTTGPDEIPHQDAGASTRFLRLHSDAPTRGPRYADRMHHSPDRQHVETACASYAFHAHACGDSLAHSASPNSCSKRLRAYDRWSNCNVCNTISTFATSR